MRFEDKESDDEHPEHDLPQRRKQDRGVGGVESGQADQRAQEFGHQSHEHRPEDRPENGPETADDDGGQIEDPELQREAVGRDGTIKIGPQAAGQPGIGGADCKAQKLLGPITAVIDPAGTAMLTSWSA